MLKKQSMKINGSDYSVETGVWAKQAGGTAILRYNDMVLMANATAAKEARDDIDFFPLTIDYREKFYAAGKMPGGFFKREGRPSNREVLIARVTDRPIRPLFPKAYVNELQIFITLLSSDGKQPGDVHAITAASAALMVSNIPFQGPVAGVRVCRINGDFKLFSDVDEQEESDINVALAGTQEAVTMIEGHSKEVGEADMLAAIKFGHEEIKKICQMQIDLAKELNIEKIAVAEKPVNEELKQKLRTMAFDKLKAANDTKIKADRSEMLNAVNTEVIETLKAELENEESDMQSKSLKEAHSFLEEFEVEIVRDQIFNDSKRADGRSLDEIRDISIEVGMLPGVHGSAMFTRGETQSLGVVTLGTDSDSQAIDDIMGARRQSFYLHYNFLPFCVGEVRRYGGVGRREIGHGRLAESALQSLIPEKEKFPYTIRVVSEILESNGSSSMASICSGSLSMMDAGVPIERSVAGIAMGLITKGEEYAILSDIAGLEDHFGDMDFKVAGTEKGITAFQLDLKISGLKYEIMEKALEQARTGRQHILAKMDSALSSARNDIAKNAPRISTMQIDKERIGELIGPGGKNIRNIIEVSGAEINVNDDGEVSIAATSGESAEKAREMIEGQFAEPEINTVYEGKVVKIADFGAFIEFMPGKDGLCHISKIAASRVANVADVLSEGDKVKVKVIAVDRNGRVSLSIKDA